MGQPKTIIRADGEGEKLWFYGGGVHTWKLSAEETNGTLFLFEDALVRGKTTPLHRHPHDEVVYLIEGELLHYSEGQTRRVARGATILHPRGVEHAFTVVSETARLLAIQTPGAGEAFYRHASEPFTGTDGRVDFAKIAAAAKATGGTEVLGPPPFGAPSQRDER